MRIELGDFKNCVTERPDKDGVYLVLGFFRGRCTYSSTIDYTVEYGWNTSVLANGEKQIANAMDYVSDTHTYFWCECPSIGESDINGTNS